MVSRMVHAPWKDTGRNEGSEGWADIGSLLAMHVVVWAKLLPGVMSEVPDSTVARVHVDVHGSCHH